MASIDKAITVTSTGRWQHEGDVDATGKLYGLSIEEGGVATIDGNTKTDTKQGTSIQLAARAQLTINGDLDSKSSDIFYSGSGSIVAQIGSQILVKGKTTLFGKRNHGLLLQSGANWSSEGVFIADGENVIGIGQATFNHHNDLTLQGKHSGLAMGGGSATINGTVSVQGKTGTGISLSDRAELVLDGDLDVKGGSGITVSSISQLSIKSPQKIAITGNANSLFVGNLCRFSSEGPMNLQAKKMALSIGNAEAFSHQGTLLAEGEEGGISISQSLATITGHTTANSKEGGWHPFKSSKPITPE